MALSDRVQNMKFMQKLQGTSNEKAKGQDGVKKVTDTSEWSSNSKSRTLKVLKAKHLKVKTVGYSSIGQAGPVNVVGIAGRRTLGETKKDKEKEGKKEDEKGSKKSKMDEKKSKKPTQELEVMAQSQRTKSLASLWKANMNKK